MNTRTYKYLLTAVVIVGIVAFDGYHLAKYLQNRPDDDLPVASEMTLDEEEDYFEFDEGLVTFDATIAAATDTHKPLRIIYDVPGLRTPEMIDANEGDAPQETPVVGVRVGEDAYAFSLRSMYEPTRHIVNAVLSDQAVSVTYCPLVDCIRVFSNESNSVIDLRMGGLNEEDMMVLLHGGKRYDMDSRKIPLVDYPYERTTLGQWKQRHPNTRVFGIVKPTVEG